MGADGGSGTGTGGDGVGGLLAALDRRTCPLGAMRDWPPTLRQAVSLILPADVQITLFWGPDHLAFYNDAYAPVIGDKHPAALGRPAAESWAETWEDLEPLLTQVRATGETVSDKNRSFYVERHGRGEVAYFDVSFSAVRDERGEVGGALCVVMETTQHVRATRNAAEERARLAQMFDQSPSFMAVLQSPGGLIELANERFAALLGRDDLVGRRLADVLPGIGAHAVDDLIDAVVASRRPFRAGGVRVAVPEERFVDVVLQPVADRNGAIGAVFLDGSDVTDRVRAEERLLLSTESLRLATEATELGVWDLDMRTDVLTWSDRAKAHFGISPHVPITMEDCWNGIHPDDLDRVRRDFAATLDPARRKPFDTEYRTIGAEDGALRWVAARGRGVFGADDECLRAVGTTIDVTDRKRAEAVLRESEARFQQLADTVPALMWISNERGEVVFANRWFETLLGKSLRDLREEGWLSIIPPEDREAVALVNRRAFETQGPASREDRVVDRHGRERWMRMEARPRFVDGAFRGYIGVAIDVTDAHLAAEALEARVGARTAELAEANNRLTAQIAERERVEQTLHQMQRLDAVGQLTSGVAHDFNNLLTVVVGNAGLVERAARAAGLDGRTIQRLENIRTAAERGAALTQQLLAFSRKQRLATRALDLNDTLVRIRPLLDGALGNAVAVDLRLADGVWPALVDPTQFELVVLNLAINARDAMEVGGALAIETANVVRGAPERPEHPPAGEFVMVSVADNGAGMPDEVLARVFEPFFTTKPVGKGSGLGLAQVFGFVKQSGGGVEIVSAPGRGTTVRVFLPRAAAAAPEAAPASVDAPADLTDTTVLLVDDDDAVRGVTADTIAEFGAVVLAAASGEAALDLLRSGREVDLVVADFAMPGMNGAELARRIAAERPDLPVVMLTGYADLDAVADVPARAIVQKPVAADELRRRLGAALRATERPLVISA